MRVRRCSATACLAAAVPCVRIALAWSHSAAMSSSLWSRRSVHIHQTMTYYLDHVQYGKQKSGDEMTCTPVRLACVMPQSANGKFRRTTRRWLFFSCAVSTTKKMEKGTDRYTRQPTVAVLVSGQRRDFDSENLQKQVLDKLPDAHVFLCMDDNYNTNIKNQTFAAHKFEPTQSGTHPQFERNEQCYNFMKTKGKYDFIVKTRPDMRYLDGALPSIDSWPDDAVQLRSRIVSEAGTKNCERSWWLPGADVRSYDMVDDQLFITPSSLADKVFTTSMGSAECTKESDWAECQFQRILNYGSVPTRRTCFNAVISKHHSVYPVDGQ